MRNLLGRLNQRPPEDLVRIAQAWRVRLTAADRLAQVAQLYRAMTDIRVVRDVWQSLPESEQAIVETLALGNEIALSLPDLATHLKRPEGDLRTDAVALYAKGIVAREGDDDPLPVGELPRLFVPREAALVFRRLHDEMSAIDLPTTPLGALLALVDDRELEEAGERWGLRIIPGLRSREEIATQLQRAIATPGRRDDVVDRLDPTAQAVWQAVLGRFDGAMPLPEAVEAAEIAGEDIPAVARRRATFAAVEESLLVWHAYGADGERLLFIPEEIRHPGERPFEAMASPTPVEGDVEEPASLPSHAIAWDLLTVLRAIAPPASIRLEDDGDLPGSVLREIRPRMWFAEASATAQGYPAFLLELAEAEELVGGADLADDLPLTLSTSMRAWRDLTFEEQTTRLRRAWLSAGSWIEGEGREDIEIIGADWAGFRLKLLAHLGALSPVRWYGLNDVATWLARRDPDMLGATFQAATAQALDARDDAERRRRVIAEAVTATMETAGSWFGLVEIMDTPQRRVVRVTERGAAIARGQSGPESPADAGPALTISAEGEITLNEPTPVRVWSLTAFADQESLGPPARYRLTEAAIQRAIAAGFAVGQVGTFLAKQSGLPPPAPVLAALEGWAKGSRHLMVEEAIVLTPADAANVDSLAELATSAGGSATMIPGALVVRGNAEVIARMLAAARKAGFSVQTPLEPPRRTGRS